MRWRGGVLGWRSLAVAIVAGIALLAAAPPATAGAPPATAGAPPATATASPSVDEIVARHVAARGGLKKIKSLATLRQTGQIDAGPGRKAIAVRELKRPGKIRFEFTVQGVTGVYVCNGTTGWQVSPFEGEMAPTALSEETVREALEQADLDGPLVDWSAKGHQLELVGRATVGDRETYKLKLTPPSGAVQYHYIDVKSYYLLRVETTRHARGRPVTIEATFSGHKKTKGLLFPRVIEFRTANRPGRMLITVDKLEVNPVLSDARFALPATGGS